MYSHILVELLLIGVWRLPILTVPKFIIQVIWFDFGGSLTTLKWWSMPIDNNNFQWKAKVNKWIKPYWRIYWIIRNDWTSASSFFSHALYIRDYCFFGYCYCSSWVVLFCYWNAIAAVIAVAAIDTAYIWYCVTFTMSPFLCLPYDNMCDDHIPCARTQ